ncbi:MAG: aminoacyl-tRNA hydrolase [Candidatus Nealsonbacteria bacterium CG_4_9_14_0_2_um_filter_37_38]|uniref:Peptidyl-tRNA hydrolase n=1 Tax=Candidatus Nealsonbacteria bacterium CG_4_10_14_0_8_um_filter_37_14 TaxID=1974684 RepID=A0A2M7R7D8_9BACT|nr:MAG: aminoacyl-tRNA hydrolase [Candidatus Nealsonbacteria bacterium CG11_big_fil_rev_8_21_14_0_20_37_68]PIW92323.1 MAG: aminoacyl-tRNA hydrolase [Candidatus Nealsonbacteria bacterium CG_4_8_14_3_um_filter_37_23]PIY89257.1 MAG: aminoacyl-tRNA hydrolase [Candidatus Nealsonbacteria bacterium CG_4_10_14_0_8_um_filter_37_14]PJC51682.1 MAG: aminoacyl-tRNA hydrolase [Candidatus Nealsonbacteria bacterium CG_4_9_14_0_2_um_filter_37_38]
MILVIGLGNPGGKYKNTRHNVGFITIDNLQLTIDNFTNWKKEKRLLAEISKGKIDNKEIILAKPQTFMNFSGKAVKKLIFNFQFSIFNLWVVHDDIDLPLGKIRIAIGRGGAGHKGVESIIKELGTKNFIRFRIGIQPKTGKPKNVERFVLQKFTKEEEETIKEVIKKTIKAIEFFLKHNLEKTMSKYNI